jgi:sporulation protein YlmC with PRC-barrel domain
MARELAAELLLSRKVVDVEGRRVGRVEELRLEEIDGETLVLEYHLGPFALLERLSAVIHQIPLFRLLPLRARDGTRVPWDLMDLSDPEHPRLRCRLEDLRARSRGSQT